MKSLLLLTLPLLALISGCGTQQHSNIADYDGEALAKEKCAQCHNLDMPPKTSDKELAPPLYTVTVHLKDWMKPPSPDALRSMFIEFVADYVRNPERKKSYCDPKSLESYGLMPSQRDKITADEARAVAAWAFDNYDQIQMLALMKERNRIAAMPPWKQVLELKDCRICHIINAGRLAPSFGEIAKKYADDPAAIEKIKSAITESSRGSWPRYKVLMRTYKDLTSEQLEGISRWILSQSPKKNGDTKKK